MSGDDRMRWQGKKVLVTGAGGFIGSHLCERFSDLNAQVTALVRYNSSGTNGLLDLLPDNPNRPLEILAGDILDEGCLVKAFKNIDMVFHLAALPSIPYSLCNPRHTFSANLQGSLNVLLTARETGVKKVIIASTGGASERRKLLSPYVGSKAAMEKVALCFHQGFGCDVRIMRLLNNYGPRQSARAVIPTIISQALVRDDVHLGALEPTMDFNFVGDTIEAFLRLAYCDSALGTVLTWGTNIATRIGDLAEMIFDIVGRPGLHVLTDEERLRPVVTSASLRDEVEATHRMLGYSPSTSLREGLKITVDWISKHLDLYKTNVYSI